MRIRPTLFALMLATCFIGPVAALEIHSKHCLYGCPVGGSGTNDLIIRDNYILSNNDLTKFADWVAYKVTKDTIGPSGGRNWKADPVLSDHETLEPEDYKDAHTHLHTDRGHQAPLASFSGTDTAAVTNFLSDITPQSSGLNQGPWKKLEEDVRDLANQAGIDGVYVMTGPLYERNVPSLPKADDAHLIPSGYWKIVGIQTEEGAKAAGFILGQGAQRDAVYCGFKVTVQEIARRSGLSFFHAPGAKLKVLDIGCP